MNLNLGDTRLIIEACKEYGCLRNQAAYLLATAYHETAHTMKPINERGGNKYFFRMYDPQGSRPKVAKRLGNTRPGDGVAYRGRGYVQITGRANYRKAGEKVGVNLLLTPERALEPEIAAEFLVAGTMEGWWTGKKLTSYITLKKSNFYNARRTVNGLDKAQHIAEIAKEYDKLLLEEGYGEEVEAEPQTQKNLLTSKELLAGGGTVTAGVASLAGALNPTAQTILIVGIIALGAFVIWNRLKARKDGER